MFCFTLKFFSNCYVCPEGAGIEAEVLRLWQDRNDGGLTMVRAGMIGGNENNKEYVWVTEVATLADGLSLEWGKESNRILT